MAALPVPPGARLISPRVSQKKLNVQKSWWWHKAKTDPDFPRIIYLSPKTPRQWEHEVDAYIERRAGTAGRVR